ncbi:MAG: hypothetical protein JWR07_1434 [Nevskia sp.]|nr:hypothetical protein [Nevskia sp.]
MENNFIYICFVFVIAGLVKGVTGMGLPTVAMSLLVLVLKPVEAAALLVVPSLLTNVWQLMAGSPVYPIWQRFWPMMAGICAGTLIGSAILPISVAATSTLGVALVVYAAIGLTGMRWHTKEASTSWLSPVIGVATGMLTAATGMFVLPAVPYLQSLGLQKEDLIQAMGLSFTASTAMLAVAMAAHGAWEPSVAGFSLMAQLPAMLGMLIGNWLRKRMQPEKFRRFFLTSMLLLGAHMVTKSF